MSLQFDNEDSLRAQRMTADEAKAVIDRWQRERSEQTGLTDHPAVPDVAEGLDLSVEEVRRLLHEVRVQRAEEETRRAQEQELTRIRLAEQERQLAELRREQAEWRRQMAFRRQTREAWRSSHPRPGGHGFGFALVICLWMAFVYWIVCLANAPRPVTYRPYVAPPSESLSNKKITHDRQTHRRSH